MMHTYAREFLTVALAHLFAVASPGPDFAIVLRQSLHHGRRVALWTSCGVGTAILVHVTYSLLGMGILLQSSPVVFSALRFAGAVYIAWLGVKALSARPVDRLETDSVARGPVPSAFGAWLTGFLTNGLNPKATLFFVALFVTAIRPTTPKLVQAGYGLWMAITTFLWFSLVSWLFSRPSAQRLFFLYGHWADRVLGVGFLLFAIFLAFGPVATR